MIKRLFIVLFTLYTATALAQDNTSSPYSYYGIGLPTFNGSAEDRAMEGLSITADSIHYNFQNPAALGKLQLTNYTLGLTQGFTTVKNGAGEKDNMRNTSFDYLAVSIPVGELSFALGINPHSSVGYRIRQITENTLSRFEGEGGLSKLFLAGGYRITDNFRLGVEGSYHFGKVKNENSFYRDGIQYGTKEINKSALRGFRFRFGAQYDYKINKSLRVLTSASYMPQTKLTSENERQMATTIINSALVESVVNQREIEVPDTEFHLPSEWRAGVGIEKFQKWFVGAEYQLIGKTEYSNTSFTADNVHFEKADIYRLGGYYIPDFDDINSYFNRMTYRAGIRYQNTGLNINQQTIDEFGISFGLGLPAGAYLSNFNLGIEYGQRGKMKSGLVKENFVNIFIGISLNDKWFNKRKYN